MVTIAGSAQQEGLVGIQQIIAHQDTSNRGFSAILSVQMATLASWTFVTNHAHPSSVTVLRIAPNLPLTVEAAAIFLGINVAGTAVSNGACSGIQGVTLAFTILLAVFARLIAQTDLRTLAFLARSLWSSGKLFRCNASRLMFLTRAFAIYRAIMDSMLLVQFVGKHVLGRLALIALQHAQRIN